MTLALYGKSRRRQGALLLGGLVAILLGMVLAFAVRGNASAAPELVEPVHTFGIGTVTGDVIGWEESGGVLDVAYWDGGAYVKNNASMWRFIDTTGYTDITVTYECYGRGGSSGDQLVVEYTINGGSTWIVYATHATNSSSSGCETDRWTPFSMDLSAIDGAENTSTQFGLRFRAVSLTGLLESVGIDDIAIMGEPEPDDDGDGVANSADDCPGTLPGAPGVNAQGCDWAQQLAGSVAANPARPNACNAGFSLVIDRSSSFTSAERASTIDQTKSFVNSVFAIPGNSPTFRIVGFSDNAIIPLGQPFTTAADATAALDSIGSATYTNWSAGLDAGNGPEVEWMIVITDGNPNRPGASNEVTLGALQAAVNSANSVKNGGAHITVIGVHTTGSAPAGFGPISQSYAELVGNGDVLTGGLADLGTILQGLTDSCETPPTIVKEFVGLNDTGTEASWTVEVTNNSQTTQSFHLVEEVVATLYATNNCQNPPAPLPVTSNPPAESPWHCGVAAGQTGTYYLTTPVDIDLCVGGGVVNDYLVRYTGTGSPADGIVEITVPGDDEECAEDLVIIKEFVGLGGYVPTLADVPTLNLPDGVTVTSEGFLDVDTYQWVLSVPNGTVGEITESLPNYWYQVEPTTCTVGEPQGSQTAELLIETQQAADCTFVNAPYGRLVINKTDGTSDGSLLWDFTVQNLPANGVDGSSLNSNPQASDNTSSIQYFVPLGTGNLFVEEDDFRLESACATANTYFSAVVAPNPDQQLTFPGDEVVWNFSNQPCGVLGTGGILIEKWEDVNGDGIISAGDQRLPGWTFTTTGEGIGAGQQVRVTNGVGQITEYISGFEAGTVLTVTESQQPGWVFVGSDVDGGPISNDSSPDIEIVGGETIVVRFLNARAEVNIVVTKTIYNDANPAGANGGAGWTFTLSGCGITPSEKTTDASGTVTWTGLPAAVNCTYTVTETARAGWIADQISKTAAPVNDGQTVTLNFVNRQFSGCTNIADCPPVTTTSTPETPTSTTTPETPTTTETPDTGETPDDPTPTNTPEEAVEGERTPGAGSPTPQAPSTGSGFAGTSAGWNILLVIAGLLSISGGLSFIALGRRTGSR